jgi:transcriptional regulator with XRE-family HTH domain
MADPIDLQIGQTIRKLRIKRAISMSVLAETAGITAQQLQKYEKGTNRVSASRLARIASVLGSDVQVFFDGTQELASSNDNLVPKKLLTHQGLSLAKAFHSISDAATRARVLAYVQRLARLERKGEIAAAAKSTPTE